MTREEIKELEAALTAFSSARAKFLTTKAEYEGKYNRYKGSQNTEDAVYYMGKCEGALYANDAAQGELEAATVKLAALLEQLEYRHIEVRDKVFAVHPEYASIFHRGYDVDTEQWTEYVAPQWAVIAMYI